MQYVENYLKENPETVSTAAATAGAVSGVYWLLMLVGRLIGGAVGGKVSSRAMLAFVAIVGLVFLALAINLPESITVDMFGIDKENGFEITTVVCIAYKRAVPHPLRSLHICDVGRDFQSVGFRLGQIHSGGFRYIYGDGLRWRYLAVHPEPYRWRRRAVELSVELLACVRFGGLPVVLCPCGQPREEGVTRYSEIKVLPFVLKENGRQNSFLW